MKRAIVFFAMLLSSTAFAEPTVADIVGKVAKIRMNGFTSDQRWITDPADFAAVLAAIGLDQSPKDPPPGGANFGVQLNFFDAQDHVHAMLGFGEKIGGKVNYLVAFGPHTYEDKGSVKLADVTALKKIIDRYVAAAAPK